MEWQDRPSDRVIGRQVSPKNFGVKRAGDLRAIGQPGEEFGLGSIDYFGTRLTAR